MEAQARRLQRGQLVVTLELHEEKDGGHEHDDGQRLVERRRQPIREVLEHGVQRRLVAAQHLDQIDHDEDGGGHRQPVGEIDRELPGQIAVDKGAEVAAADLPPAPARR